VAGELDLARELEPVARRVHPALAGHERAQQLALGEHAEAGSHQCGRQRGEAFAGTVQGARDVAGEAGGECAFVPAGLGRDIAPGHGIGIRHERLPVAERHELAVVVELQRRDHG